MLATYVSAFICLGAILNRTGLLNIMNQYLHILFHSILVYNVLWQMVSQEIQQGIFCWIHTRGYTKSRLMYLSLITYCSTPEFHACQSPAIAFTDLNFCMLAPAIIAEQMTTFHGCCVLNFNVTEAYTTLCVIHTNYHQKKILQYPQ